MKLDRPCARGLPGANGNFCPRYVNDPQTAEGRAALRVALSPGIWQRVGMDGAVAGIHWSSARALAAGLAEGHAWPRLVRLLSRFETGALKALAKRSKKDKES